VQEKQDITELAMDVAEHLAWNLSAPQGWLFRKELLHFPRQSFYGMRYSRTLSSFIQGQ
jgi:hypothetical protein